MTKDQLQKELQAKVKPGVKPSDLRKLKRSKSDGDIPKVPPLPNSVPLSKSQSNPPIPEVKYPYTTLISQQEELDKLQKETIAKSDTIALLRKKIEELETQLKTNPPSQLLQDQLTEKQQEIEKLRQQLEITNQELNSLKATQSTLLDTNLELKHQGLKDWFQQYQQTKNLDKELAENIDEASNELEKQDQTISQLRSEVRSLKREKGSLQKDLDLATKLAEMRRVPLPDNSPPLPYLKWGLYSLAGVLFTLWLLNSKN